MGTLTTFGQPARFWTAGTKSERHSSSTPGEFVHGRDGARHRLTQRGNRRQTTFLEACDCELYLAIKAETLAAAGMEIWAYCLMPNFASFPVDEDCLRARIRCVELKSVRAGLTRPALRPRRG